MEATARRPLQTGRNFDRLFRPQQGGSLTVERVASIEGTLKLIRQVIHETLPQTRPLADWFRRHYAGASREVLLRAVWTWVYQHIQYERDSEGFEEIREPFRIWADRVRGVDCDDYTVFISSLLINLGIGPVAKMTAYEKKDGRIVEPGSGGRVGEWQHIYVIVPKDGKTYRSRSDYWTLDCVTDAFDKEVKPAKTKHIDMLELVRLNGLDGLGLFNAKKAKARQEARIAAAVPGQNNAPVRKTIVGKILQKATKGVAKVTASPVRAAWLAILKANKKGGSAKLRWGYLSKEQAVAKGKNLKFWEEARRQLLKVQNTFIKVGGDAKALKTAILNGKGNRDRAVLAGFGGLEGATNLGYIVGIGDYADHYDQEALGLMAELEGCRCGRGVGGLGELGVVVTAAVSAAALPVVLKVLDAVLAALNRIPENADGTSDYTEETADEDPIVEDSIEGLAALEAKLRPGTVKTAVQKTKAKLAPQKQKGKKRQPAPVRQAVAPTPQRVVVPVRPLATRPPVTLKPASPNSLAVKTERIQAPVVTVPAKKEKTAAGKALQRIGNGVVSTVKEVATSKIQQTRDRIEPPKPARQAPRQTDEIITPEVIDDGNKSNILPLVAAGVAAVAVGAMVFGGRKNSGTSGVGELVRFKTADGKAVRFQAKPGASKRRGIGDIGQVALT